MGGKKQSAEGWILKHQSFSILLFRVATSESKTVTRWWTEWKTISLRNLFFFLFLFSVQKDTIVVSKRKWTCPQAFNLAENPLKHFSTLILEPSLFHVYNLSVCISFPGGQINLFWKFSLSHFCLQTCMTDITLLECIEWHFKFFSKKEIINSI